MKSNERARDREREKENCWNHSGDLSSENASFGKGLDKRDRKRWMRWFYSITKCTDNNAIVINIWRRSYNGLRIQFIWKKQWYTLLTGYDMVVHSWKNPSVFSFRSIVLFRFQVCFIMCLVRGTIRAYLQMLSKGIDAELIYLFRSAICSVYIYILLSIKATGIKFFSCRCCFMSLCTLNWDVRIFGVCMMSIWTDIWPCAKNRSSVSARN